MVKNPNKPASPVILSAKDQSIWRTYTTNVQPLPGQADKYVLPVPPTTVDKPSQTSPYDTPLPTTFNESQFLPLFSPPSPAAPILSSKKIKPPRIIDGRLDLHGLTQVQAYNAVLRFIAAHYQRHSQTLIIITGKGFMRPHDHARLSLAEALPGWLRQPPLDGYVRTFSIAHLKHGGRGAYYIYLKKL